MSRIGQTTKYSEHKKRKGQAIHLFHESISTEDGQKNYGHQVHSNLSAETDIWRARSKKAEQREITFEINNCNYQPDNCKIEITCSDFPLS